LPAINRIDHDPIALRPSSAASTRLVCGDDHSSRGGRNSNEMGLGVRQLPARRSHTRQVRHSGRWSIGIKTWSKIPVPTASQAEALSRHGGVLPPGTELVPGRSERVTLQCGFDTAESWYLLSLCPCRHRRDLRSAAKTRILSNPGMWHGETSRFRRKLPARFGPYHRAKQGPPRWPLYWRHRVYSAPVINGALMIPV